MANTIAEAWGFDRSRIKETHRLGSEEAQAQAATYRTSARVNVCKDGSGVVTVKRDGKIIHTWEFGPEGESNS